MPNILPYTGEMAVNKTDKSPWAIDPAFLFPTQGDPYKRNIGFTPIVTLVKEVKSCGTSPYLWV